MSTILKGVGKKGGGKAGKSSRRGKRLRAGHGSAATAVTMAAADRGSGRGASLATVRTHVSFWSPSELLAAPSAAWPTHNSDALAGDCLHSCRLLTKLRAPHMSCTCRVASPLASRKRQW